MVDHLPLDEETRTIWRFWKSLDSWAKLLEATVHVSKGQGQCGCTRVLQIASAKADRGMVVWGLINAPFFPDLS